MYAFGYDGWKGRVLHITDFYINKEHRGKQWLEPEGSRGESPKLFFPIPHLPMIQVSISLVVTLHLRPLRSTDRAGLEPR